MKKKIVMLKRIVGLKGSHNSLIILKKEKEIGLVKKNCRLRMIKKKQVVVKKKKIKNMFVEVLLRKWIICGLLILVTQTTCFVIKIFFLTWI